MPRLSHVQLVPLFPKRQQCRPGNVHNENDGNTLPSNWFSNQVQGACLSHKNQGHKAQAKT